MAGQGGSVGQDWAVIMESVAALEREDAGPGGHAAAVVRAPIPKKPTPPKPPQAPCLQQLTLLASYVSNLDCSASEASSVDRSSGPMGHAAAAVRAPIPKKPPPPKPPQTLAFSNSATSSTYVSNLDCSASEVSFVDRSSGPGGHAAAVAKAPPPKPRQAVAATYSIASAPEHSVSEARASPAPQPQAHRGDIARVGTFWSCHCSADEVAEKGVERSRA